MPKSRVPDLPTAVALDAADPQVERRAPFSENPKVGARGLRTQQRILDAAVEVFGEDGYFPSTIDQIAERAGCSRATFYQYFSTKQAVFHQLTGQVARQLSASVEAIGPLTPDAAGWDEIRAWVGRHAAIYRRYEPVFHAFPTAADGDGQVKDGSARWQQRNIERLRSRLTVTSSPPRQIDSLLLLVLAGLTRTLDMVELLRSSAPEGYPADRVDDALADVVHRALFGRDDAVNVHPAPPTRLPVLRLAPADGDALDRRHAGADLTTAGNQTLAELMDSGRQAFVRLGYHGTRVDDVVAAAELSHGAFYRYFENKDHLARVLTAQAMEAVSEVLGAIPPVEEDETAGERAALRRWVRRYATTQAREAAMLRVSVDAALQDATLRTSSAPALDWGRRRMATYLRPRGFGDVDTEGLLLVALLSALGATERPPRVLDAATTFIERGFLGRR